MTPTDREHREIQVTLHDGRVVGSWSEDWRAECEARGLLKMPSKEERNRHLALVVKKRGEEAAERLRQHALRIWRAEHKDVAGPRN